MATANEWLWCSLSTTLYFVTACFQTWNFRQGALSDQGSLSCNYRRSWAPRAILDDRYRSRETGRASIPVAVVNQELDSIARFQYERWWSRVRGDPPKKNGWTYGAGKVLSGQTIYDLWINGKWIANLSIPAERSRSRYDPRSSPAAGINWTPLLSLSCKIGVKLCSQCHDLIVIFLVSRGSCSCRVDKSWQAMSPRKRPNNLQPRGDKPCLPKFCSLLLGKDVSRKQYILNLNSSKSSL